MTSKSGTSQLVIFVDVSSRSSAPNQREIDARLATQQILSELNDRRLAATWCLPETMIPSLGGSLQHNPAVEEIALRIERTNKLSSSTTTWSEIKRGLVRAKLAQIEVATLAIEDLRLAPPHLKLVKSGIQTIRCDFNSRRRGRLANSPMNLAEIRYGLWCATPQYRIPQGGVIGRVFWGGSILRAMHRAGDPTQLILCQIDVSAAGAKSTVHRQVRQVLDMAARQRDRGRLGVVSLRECVAQITSKRSGRADSSRSVLRAA